MSSKLIITGVENLQSQIVKTIKAMSGLAGVYVSLNKPQEAVLNFLENQGVNASKIFFIDCVSSGQTSDRLNISPDNLQRLFDAIDYFIQEIPQEKFLLIDALSILLIYNNEQDVAAFVKKISEFSAKKGVIILAFSPYTRGEELLKKVFNFFDEVENPISVSDDSLTKNGEELIY